MKKNVKVISIFFLFAAIIVFLFGWVLPIAFQLFLHNVWVRGGTLLAIFAAVVLGKRLTWNNGLVYIIGIFAVFGMFMDSSGNPLTNKPLEWIVSPFGELRILQHVNNYAPGEYAINDEMTIIRSGGEAVRLSVAFLYFYRFVQIVVLYSAVGTVLGWLAKLLPQRAVPLPSSPQTEEALPADLKQRMEAEHERRQQEAGQRFLIPEEIKPAVLEMKQKGELIRAIKLVRQHTDLSLGEAKKLVEQMKA